MQETGAGRKIGFHIREYIFLLLILLFNGLLYIAFAPGTGFGNTLELIQIAARVSSTLGGVNSAGLQSAIESLQGLRAEFGLRQLMAALPLGGFYLILGGSPKITDLFLLVSSSVNLILIYNIARQAVSRKGATIACMVWTMIPYQIGVSGNWVNLSFAAPLFLLGLYALLHARKNGKPYWLSTALLIAFYLHVIQPWASTALIAALLAIRVERTKPGAAQPLLLLFLAAVFFYSVYQGGSELTPPWEFLLEPGLNVLIPLFLVSLVYAFQESRREPTEIFLLVLAGISSAMIVWNLQQDNGFTLAILLALAGFCIFVGYLFDQWVGQDFLERGLPFVLAVIALLALLGVRGQNELIPALVGLRWTRNPFSIFMLSNIMAGLFFFLVLVIPVLVENIKTAQLRAWFSLAFLALFAFSMLSPIWQKVRPYRTLTDAYRAAAAFLGEAQIALPVFLPNPADRALLGYYSGSSFGADSQQGKQVEVSRGWRDAEFIEDGYILAREGALLEVPETWLKLESFGQLGAPSRLVLYRAMAPDSAALEALTASGGQPDAAGYFRLYGALIHSGEPCAAYQMWMAARELGGGPPDSIPIRTDMDCFGEFLGSQVGGDFLEPGDLRAYSGFTVQGLSGHTEDGTPSWSFRQRYLLYDDPRAYDLRAELSRGSFYLYSVDVRGRGQEPFYTLYWRIDDTEQYLDHRAYPEWETVSVLIYSGESELTKVPMRFSPILVDNYGIVFFKDIELREVFP